MKILNLPLSRSVVDRAAHVRTDPAALDAAWSKAKIIHFNGEGFLLENGALRYLSAQEIAGSGERIFLGEHAGDSYFMWCAALNIGAEDHYQTLRAIGHTLSDLDIGLAVHGQAIALWHHQTPLCSSCGSALVPAQGGATRKCVGEGHEHFPRTDPAIIVLIKDHSDRILLGRQKVWPEHRFSTFAGFVESGESIEQCVVREVFEEASVAVDEINYLGSQPWPFPRSLMIACEATIVDPANARPDGEEIEEIRWFDRDSIYAAVQEGTLLLPPAMSVARAMIQAWYGDDRPELSTAETWRN